LEGEQGEGDPQEHRPMIAEQKLRRGTETVTLVPWLDDAAAPHPVPSPESSLLRPCSHR
jgi:hypothetical protein